MVVPGPARLMLYTGLMTNDIRAALDHLADAITSWSSNRLDQPGQNAAADRLMTLLATTPRKNYTRWLADFAATKAHYETTRDDGYIDWSIPTHGALQEAKADDQRAGEGDETMWCRTCARRRIIVDRDIESERERHGEREVRVLMLNCGHNRAFPTGRFVGYTVDATGMPYL